MSELEFSSLSNSQGMFGEYETPAEHALGLSNPDSMLAGQLRGTQNVGGAGAAIDAANNVIRLTDPLTGATVGFGNIPGSTTGEFGFFGLDRSGNLIMKIINGEIYTYDSSRRNVVHLGKLPSGSYGLDSATPGYDISQGYS